MWCSSVSAEYVGVSHCVVPSTVILHLLENSPLRRACDTKIYIRVDIVGVASCSCDIVFSLYITSSRRQSDIGVGGHNTVEYLI